MYSVGLGSLLTISGSLSLGASICGTLHGLYEAGRVREGGTGQWAPFPLMGWVSSGYLAVALVSSRLIPRGSLLSALTVWSGATALSCGAVALVGACRNQDVWVQGDLEWEQKGDLRGFRSRPLDALALLSLVVSVGLMVWR